MSPSPLALAGLLPLDDLPYADQLALREARVATALRNGRLEVDVRPIVASPLQTGARARVKLRGDARGRLGFHKPGSHEMVYPPLERLARPEIVAAAAEVEARGRVRGEIELRSDGQTVAADKANAGLPTGALWIDGLRVSAQSFSQVNLEVNRRVVDDVDQRLQALAPAGLLDLYGGIGNLSVRAARRGTPVVLVEREGAAVGDARLNLKGTGAKVLAKDALRFEPGEAFFDVAVLDPPRAGAPGLLQRIVVTRPRAILYLSCDPATLARDLGTLKGYRIVEVQPYDMFPGTEHVETLVVLERA